MQVSQAVNAWRDLTDAAGTAAEAQGATRPSQDITATVGMTGVTTVNARLASSSAVSSAIARSAAPSAAPTAAAAADDDESDDGLELVGEQTLDEVLAVCVLIACKAMPKQSSWQLAAWVGCASVECANTCLFRDLQGVQKWGPEHCLRCVPFYRVGCVPGCGFACWLAQGYLQYTVSGDTVAWSTLSVLR